MIEAIGLGVRLGRDAPPVLAGVDLTLARGDILGLIGPPESGKTVLIKTLAGLLAPTSGQIQCDGARVDRQPHAELVAWQLRIGMAFQNDALFDALTVYENVAFPLRRRRVADVEVQRRVMDRLGGVGLTEARSKLPAEISGGMRKRVGIARATVIDPELGLFDDPTAGLDPVTGGVILDLIVELTASLNMATVVSSNDLDVLLPICQRVMMLNQGRVAYWGEPHGLIHSERPEVVQFATGGDEGPL